MTTLPDDQQTTPGVDAIDDLIENQITEIAVPSKEEAAAVSFESLGLHPRILQALDKLGYTAPTPIQVAAIPLIMEGRDVMGIAQTGSGKTGAFALPILNRYAGSTEEPNPNTPDVLILSPTRELALQIDDSIKDYSRYFTLFHNAAFGGVSLNRQTRELDKGLDVQVGTPGRLLDLLGRGILHLDGVKVVVLDEADRMLDMGFLPDIRRIISTLPKERQSMFFSATMSGAVEELANTFLRNPVKIDLSTPTRTAELIEQRVLFVKDQEKPALLRALMSADEVEKAIVFCQTKSKANIVVKQLDVMAFPTEVIHSDLNQEARIKALQDFKDGKVKVLVATDIAARGLDIAEVSHVINYEVPEDTESYIHRVGRTARAGRSGVAFTFCDPSEFPAFRQLEKAIGRTIPVVGEEQWTGSFTAWSKGSEESTSAADDKRRRMGRR